MTICSIDDAVARQAAEVLERLLADAELLNERLCFGDRDGAVSRLGSLLAGAAVLGRVVGPEWSEYRLEAIVDALVAIADDEAIAAGGHLRLIEG